MCFFPGFAILSQGKNKRVEDTNLKSHFLRKELKYRLSIAQMEELIVLLGSDLVYDNYNLSGVPYPITSIYYDTKHYDVIRHSTSHPKHKAKLRLRIYENQSHFLELKQKFKGIVYKKRIQLTKIESDDFVSNLILPTRADYRQNFVLSEMKAFLDQYCPLIRPVQIDYQRTAYVFGPTKEKVRITFDKNVKVRAVNQTNWTDLIDTDEVLMEIKVKITLPLKLVKALSHLKIYPASFSKYGKYYEMQLKKGAIRYV